MCKTANSFAHHVNFVLIHHDASAKEKGKHEFVLLKQAAAHIAVQAEGEKFIDVDDSLLHRVCKKRVEKKSVFFLFYCIFCTSGVHVLNVELCAVVQS